MATVEREEALSSIFVPDELGMEDVTDSRIAASKEKAIGALLEICAANQVDINENLRRAILGEELYNESKQRKMVRRQTFGKRESVLGALVRSYEQQSKTDVIETDFTREIRECMKSKMKSLKRFDAPFEVRIRNGSYTVKTDGSTSGKRGQRIPTVANSGALLKVSWLLG